MLPETPISKSATPPLKRELYLPVPLLATILFFLCKNQTILMQERKNERNKKKKQKPDTSSPLNLPTFPLSLSKTKKRVEPTRPVSELLNAPSNAFQRLPVNPTRFFRKTAGGGAMNTTTNPRREKNSCRLDRCLAPGMMSCRRCS